MNYHFGTKEDLFKAVVERRFREIDADRQERFAALEPALRRMTRREIVEAVADIFMVPILDRVTTGEPGWALQLLRVCSDSLTVPFTWKANTGKGVLSILN